MSNYTPETQKKIADREIIDSIEQLLNYKGTHQALSTTEPCVIDTGDWQINDLELLNTKSDYFRISLYKNETNATRFLITQCQPALVMLLLTEVEGKLCALLNIRYEPGLIDSVNYTTTIQSTPNNYLRQHGGKETPFLEFVKNPQDYGTVLFDTENYDWGDLYILKRKRYLIIKVNNYVAPPSGFFWVTRQTLVQMATQDQLITNDLRVCIPLLDIETPASIPGEVSLDKAQKTIAKLPFNYETFDSEGIHIRFFRARTRAREVATWTQPLLAGYKSRQINLTFKENAGSRQYALTRASQIGLLGRTVWFPAEVAAADVCSSVCTSAEGGRFWRHAIHIQLLRLTTDINAADENEKIVWVSEKQLLDMIATPLATSLELRMALSLVDLTA